MDTFLVEFVFLIPKYSKIYFSCCFFIYILNIYQLVAVKWVMTMACTTKIWI
jgi:hypothetical protein